MFELSASIYRRDDRFGDLSGCVDLFRQLIVGEPRLMVNRSK